MSAIDEVEEGEITDDEEGEISDRGQVPANPVAVSAGPCYSIFDQPKNTLRPAPLPRGSDSESESSGSSDEDDYYDSGKKKKVQSREQLHQQAFVNPNLVKSGGVMPPLPKPSAKNVWSNVIQEQILTAEVGSFSMEKKVDNDRDIESYDYMRAKDDDRPNMVEEQTDGGDDKDDLFGEVIDLEKAAFKQSRTLKRKHVAERLGKKNSVKDRLDFAKVTENNTVEEVTYYISTMLDEPKLHLIRRVVTVLGRARALGLYRETEEIEKNGGMMIMNGQRRRTKGGVYLTLLKTKPDITKKQVEDIFEEDQKRFMERKKMLRKKAKARKRWEKKAQKDSAGTKDENSSSQPAMEVAGEEESNSRSSVEGQRGSPRHSGDHLSDTQCSGGDHLEGEASDSTSASEEEEEEDFDAQLARELGRQAQSKEKKEGGGDADGEGMTGGGDADGDGITLDDVLDIGVDEDFID